MILGGPVIVGSPRANRSVRSASAAKVEVGDNNRLSAILVSWDRPRAVCVRLALRCLGRTAP
jgi:hypothetical protein